MKSLVLLVLGLTFFGCQLITEAAKLKPDVEVTRINPMAASVDTGCWVTIDEIALVPKNSVDCHLEKLLLEYYTKADTNFFGPFEIPLFMKIKGVVEPAHVDTTIIENVPLPIDTVRTYLISRKIYEAKALLNFVVVDAYGKGQSDTAVGWFGLFRTP